MGITIKITGANFTDYVSKPILPIRSGLVGEYYFGTSERDTLRNWANPDLPLLPHGTLSTDAYSTTYESTVGGFSTGLPETAEHTVIFVGGKVQEALISFLVHNFSYDRALPFSGLWSWGSSTVPAIVHFTGDNSSPAAGNYIQAFTNPEALAQDRICIGRSVGLAGTPPTLKSDFWLDGVKTSASRLDTHNRVVGANPWAIGYAPDAGGFDNGSEVKVRMAAIYNRALSDLEAAQVAAWLRAYYASRGVAL